MRTLFVVACVVCASVASAYAAPWTGTVIRVRSGDTMTVKRDGARIQVTLFGVECPEKRQPYAEEARKLTRSLVDGQVVTVSPVSEDKKGVVAKVSLMKTEVIEVLRGGRRDQRKVKVPVRVREELVRAGLAWQRPEAGGDKRLAKLQARARHAKRGLWADPNPTPPWEWGKKSK